MTSRLIFGIIIITLGALYTLDNFGMVDAGRILRWWPALVFAYGVFRLTGFCCDRRPALGLVLTIVGGLLLLHAAGKLPYDVWDFWPLILIGIGFGMVSRAMGRGIDPVTGGNPANRMSAFAMWSSIKRRVTGTEFTGGDVTAIMGGHEIDLRDAKTAPDGRVVLDLFVWWGGVEMRIPEDWAVSCEAVVLMGGIDHRGKSAPTGPKATLVLKGLVIMGGVDIRN
jgi:predicted membrane protein